jgi:hypothetical protein
MPNIADLYHEEGPAAVTNDGLSKTEKQKKSSSNGANGPSNENPKRGGFKESKKIK